MKSCDYCGKDNPESAPACLGCGSPLTREQDVAGRMASGKTIGPFSAATLALAAMWFPFIIGAALSGDRDINRGLFLLPGLFLASGSELGAAVMAGIMSLGMAGGGFAVARRSGRFYFGLVGVAFALFCGLALITVLGMLV